VKEDQMTEEQIFNNHEHSKAFDDFLDLLGERVRLKGFGKYRGGLDIVNDLTGTHSVHATNGNKLVMFHVSTLLPFEKKDVQKVTMMTHTSMFSDNYLLLPLPLGELLCHTPFNRLCVIEAKSTVPLFLVPP
jgi:hypothetical protein